MATGMNTCGYCTIPIFLHFGGSFALPCPNCLDVPEGDLHGERSSIYYCSQSHLARGAAEHQSLCHDRCLKRTLIRVAAVSAMYYKCHRANMAFIDVLSCTKTNTHQEFVVEYNEKSRIQQPLQDDVLTALSAGESMNAAAMLAPLLAWLLEDLPVAIKEVRAHPVRASTAHIFQIFPDRLVEQDLENMHTFITLLPSKTRKKRQTDGIALDVTSMQHGHRVTSHAASTYYRRYVQRGKPMDRLHFASHFMAAFRGGTKLFKPTYKATLSSWIGEVACNGAILQNINALGGKEELYNQSHEDFVTQLNTMQNRLTNDLQSLRDRVDKIPDGDPEAVKKLLNIAPRYGNGNRIMLKALQKRVMRYRE